MKYIDCNLILYTVIICIFFKYITSKSNYYIY